MEFENRASALNPRARVGDSDRLARISVSDKAAHFSNRSGAHSTLVPIIGTSIVNHRVPIGF